MRFDPADDRCAHFQMARLGHGCQCITDRQKASAALRPARAARVRQTAKSLGGHGARAAVRAGRAAEILHRCDGNASIAAIVDALAAEFDAPREEIAADVLALVAELCEQGVLTL